MRLGVGRRTGSRRAPRASSLANVPSTIRAPRLLLRRWRSDDADPFADLNADPEVMEHFPAPLSREESDVLAQMIDLTLAERGWGLWAVQVAAGPDVGRFAGFTGITVPTWDPPFGDAVEVGWRLARWAWGLGYATEAASAALDVAFDDLGLAEVVSFTSHSNLRSQAVMRRLGMQRDPIRDFDHPMIEAGHPLSPHVLYTISAGQWRERSGAVDPTSPKA